MDSTKQIIIGYYALKDACDAMLKPIVTNLNDGETVHSMSKAQQSALEYIQTACEGIRRALGCIEGEIDELKESIFDDGEVGKSREMINDILFDVHPTPTKTTQQTIHLKFVRDALEAAEKTKRALYGRV